MTKTRPVKDYGSLVTALTERKKTLSKRLQQVAQFFLNNPEDVAIYTIIEIAKQADVQPSTISRFAKELGFDGFSELQNVFRQRLVGPRMTYADRMQALADASAKYKNSQFDLDDPSVVFDTFVQAAMDTLLRLREDMSGEDIAKFIEVLLHAKGVHILAARGAFGVGAYCYYGFSRIGKRAHLIDNLGSMRALQLAAVEDEDVILVLTFDDYTPETIELALEAKKLGKKLLIITDNELSPVADIGEHTLYVKDARLGHFRSQVPAMIICQSIIVSLGRAMERTKSA